MLSERDEEENKIQLYRQQQLWQLIKHKRISWRSRKHSCNVHSNPFVLGRERFFGESLLKWRYKISDYHYHHQIEQ